MPGKSLKIRVHAKAVPSPEINGPDFRCKFHSVPLHAGFHAEERNKIFLP